MITLANLSELGNIDYCGRRPFVTASVELKQRLSSICSRRETRATQRSRGCIGPEKGQDCRGSSRPRSIFP